MKNLYLIHLGGKVNGANIEVHDIQCVAADTIENTFIELKEDWFGDMDSLHIDSYKVIDFVDGHVVVMNQASDLNLFLVQIGGYQSDYHHEFHETALLIGKDLSEVRKRVSEEIFKDFEKQHIDSIVNLSEKLSKKGVQVGFVQSNEVEKTKPDWYGFLRVK